MPGWTRNLVSALLALFGRGMEGRAAEALGAAEEATEAPNGGSAEAGPAPGVPIAPREVQAVIPPPGTLGSPQTLREKQSLFAWLLARLILKMYDAGYEVSVGSVFALAGEGGHMPGSLHTLKLAADLNLYKNGVYLTTTEAHEAFGEWWESQHELCRWGGRFKKPDGNHYSITHGGRA
jgi:hypothetical protein